MFTAPAPTEIVMDPAAAGLDGKDWEKEVDDLVSWSNNLDTATIDTWRHFLALAKYRVCFIASTTGFGGDGVSVDFLLFKCALSHWQQVLSRAFSRLSSHCCSRVLYCIDNIFSSQDFNRFSSHCASAVVLLFVSVYKTYHMCKTRLV